ncbi:thioesterase II family protein [Streptomyces sp. NPDC057271]|uniref:thioesterase II family protein n=1 Tax=unclassified Streptomyces TaxID=2593676 RepID=UPI00363BA3A4
MRLVLLPHAGGSASFFHSWKGAFGDDVEVLTCHYPGRQQRFREPAIGSMDQLADAVHAALLPFLEIPLALFGHSMGACLAYEVTLRLQDQQRFRPAALFVSGSMAPHTRSPRDVHSGGDQAILDEMRRLGGTAYGVLEDPELRELILPALRADFRIAGMYRAPSPRPVHCPVRAYVGDRDPDVSVDGVRGWEEVAAQGFAARVLPGDHFYLVSSQEELVRAVTTELEELTGPACVATSTPPAPGA